jgi:hypothetical protein
MTHTYLRMSAGDYQIGQWLRHPEGYDRFNELFSVATLQQAFAAVNMLNGGFMPPINDFPVKERA